MANERKTVMISSTARDLPDHRKEVMDACLRQGMFPDMMEQLPATDADAIRVSLDMVDRADIYLGIFAHRYGYTPKENNPQNISITEMEYNRAVERGIPRLIFIMHDDHQLRASDVDTGESAEKLKKFKDRIGTDRVAGFFKSPVDLRSQAIQALVPYRDSDITKFHYVSNIPQPPEAYIAHPYTLLQTHRLIGRQKELNLLTNWVTKKQEEIYWTRILNIVAIGGMGKSALTWKWFNDIAPQEMKPLAGRMWWSFYESDASFENFIIRALAYVSKRSREDIEKNTKPGEREEQLLQILDREPYLFVLDGLERILIAYARMDAARLSDDDFDKQTANYVAKAYGLPESAGQSFVGQHQLRKTADPRAGSFLRKLANIRSARVLVSTRLYPADLQHTMGEPIRGCFAIFLPGLNDDDALNLWRAFSVSGSREALLPMFQKFENHPLLMQSLASEVANYRRAPGDFDRWQKDHPKFDPFSLSMTHVKGHVLGFAMQGLYQNARKVLETIAAFRMPAHYDALAAIFVGEGKLFPTELGLDQALKELEERGLLGWDKRANRYDLHPIVRGVVWSGLGDETRQDVYSNLQIYFEPLSSVKSNEINSLEDLTPAIELFNTLLGLNLYSEAFTVAMDHLFESMQFRLGLSRNFAELFEPLIPGLANLGMDIENTNILKAVASLFLEFSYIHTGQLGKALDLYNSQSNILERSWDYSDREQFFSAGFSAGYIARAFFLSGKSHQAESNLLKWLHNAGDHNDNYLKSSILSHLGIGYASRGNNEKASNALIRATRMSVDTTTKGWSIMNIIQLALWDKKHEYALALTKHAWKSIHNYSYELDIIRMARLHGTTLLKLHNMETAYERLQDALTRARVANFVEEEVPIFISLAELRQSQRDLIAARELLDNVWEPAERGPYPLFHADAFNVLAQIERDEGNKDKAIESAAKAYRLSWCDGPPFAYYWGLEKAKQHLKELGAPEPSMPPFDESKYEPMPEVEINPKDEFWVDPDKKFDIDNFLKEQEE